MSWANAGVFDGLDKVDELELDNESYSFNLIGAWRGEDGYYLGTDSGCSCPTPWESYQREELTGPLTAEQARAEIEDHFKFESSGWGRTNRDEAEGFLAEIV